MKYKNTNFTTLWPRYWHHKLKPCHIKFILRLFINNNRVIFNQKCAQTSFPTSRLVKCRTIQCHQPNRNPRKIPEIGWRLKFMGSSKLMHQGVPKKLFFFKFAIFLDHSCQMAFKYTTKVSKLQTNKQKSASTFQFYIIITMGISAKNEIWS